MTAWKRSWVVLLPILCLAGAAAHGADPAADGVFVLDAANFAERTVEAQTSPGRSWTPYRATILKDIPDGVLHLGYAQSRFGGWLERRTEATGFFRAEKIDGRWWLIDPDGYYFLHRAVVGVRPGSSRNAQQSFLARYRTTDTWAQDTTDLLWAFGFNGTGAWSDVRSLRSADRPAVYTQMWNFMSEYGRVRGGTYQLPGHTGYPNDAIFVFDPEFERFAFSYAQRLGETRDDPYLLGHFSDNELPFPRDGLDKYLSLPPDDPGYKAAYEWLRERQGRDEPDLGAITELDRLMWNGYVAERYLSIVSRAIKSVDPNHMYLGPRFHGSALNNPYIFEAAGKYLDAVGVNLYNRWEPRLSELQEWERRAEKPIVITEWYTKAEDSGLPNTSGAGWIVRTQSDRGDFYQNFVLRLLESRVVVGWHWFRYMDNDPEDPTEDPSNRDANKGIVGVDYEPYCELLDSMRTMNLLSYALVQYLDGEAVSIPVDRAGELATSFRTRPEQYCRLPVRFEIAAPKERETVSGALHLELDSAHDLAAARFFVDDVEVDPEPAGRNRWILDTTQLEDGYHTLRAVYAGADGGTQVQRYVQFRVSNWWTLDDWFEPPLAAGWFGTFGREKTAAESPGWRYVTEGRPFGFASRKVRTEDTDAHLVWETPNLSAFSVTLLTATPAIAEPILVEISADGTTWHPVDYAVHTAPQADAGWYRHELTGSIDWTASIEPAGSTAHGAAGVAYFRVTVPRQGLPADSVQLGRVYLRGRVSR